MIMELGTIILLLLLGLAIGLGAGAAVVYYVMRAKAQTLQRDLDIE
jgi:hypothetical protein